MEEQKEQDQRPSLQPRESSVASFQTAKDGSDEKPEDVLERLNLGKPITETETTTRVSVDTPRHLTVDAPTTTTATPGRTRSGSATASGGMRFASGGHVQHSATGLERESSAGPSQPHGVGRRSSIVEASGAQLKSWWNNFTGAPAVGEESTINTSPEQPGVAAISTSTSGTALKREPSRPEKEKGNVVFGEKLEMSLIYAAVPISTARHEPPTSGSSGEGSSGSGGMYVWGYVPVVVAKW